MDIPCLRCAEPWDVSHIVDDAEEGDFDRKGAVISRCPCCRVNERERGPLPAGLRENLEALRPALALQGDDLDGAACFWEDIGRFQVYCLYSGKKS